MKNYSQRLEQFRAKRLEVLAKTRICDADNKIARMDSIERYYLTRAWVEIADQLFIFHH